MIDHPKAEKFFTDAEKQAIKQATDSAESCTMGQIAVMIVDQSSDYHEAQILGGVILGSFVALILTTLWFHDSIWWYIPFSCALFFPASLLFKKSHALKIHCIGNKRKERAVKERALKAFYEKGLYKTQHNTGVLFFISLLERKVWVLADKGIHEKIKQVTLNKFARHVAQGIRARRSSQALIEAIAEAGTLLAEHYPREAGCTVQLPDTIIYENRTESD
ncbi:MAG TPA: TPM domain-containing protein [Syntrophorhabdaceae bacterium]|nr:TPM domain-containing protein [Syntrophorhabdaceae bacterium]